MAPGKVSLILFVPKKQLLAKVWNVHTSGVGHMCYHPHLMAETQAQKPKQYIPRPARKVQSMALILPNLLRSPAKRRGFMEAQLVSQWHQICAEYRAYSIPQRLTRNGVLHVGVNSSSALANMQLWLPTLKARVNSFCGYELVQGIRLHVVAFKSKPPSTVVEASVSEQSQQKALRVCEKVANADLKKALVGLGSRIYK